MRRGWLKTSISLVFWKQAAGYNDDKLNSEKETAYSAGRHPSKISPHGEFQHFGGESTALRRGADRIKKRRELFLFNYETPSWRNTRAVAEAFSTLGREKYKKKQDKIRHARSSVHSSLPQHTSQTHITHTQGSEQVIRGHFWKSAQCACFPWFFLAPKQFLI